MFIKPFLGALLWDAGLGVQMHHTLGEFFKKKNISVTVSSDVFLQHLSLITSVAVLPGNSSANLQSILGALTNESSRFPSIISPF